MKNLIRQLQILKTIEPDRSYAARSRFIIINTHQSPVPKWGISLEDIFHTLMRPKATISVVAIIILILAISKAPFQKPALAGLNNPELSNEANSLNQQITAPELDYYMKSRQSIDDALEEIDDQANYINEKLLNQETERAKNHGLIDLGIDNLIDQIIQSK